ncbi:MAG: protease modulator HflK [Verrucomicrobia bacterium]|nr:protease modulator HflK [Verrucomicrobiota bacterium]
MSDHDHSHSHGPGDPSHSHGPGTEAPAHSHSHGPGAPEPEHELPMEDSSTQALSDALKSSFLVVRVVMAGLIVLFFASGIFTVGPQEVAIKLLFGAPTGIGEAALLKPGLHWSFPFPINEIVKIPKGQVHTVVSSAGWYPVTREQELAGQEPAAGGTLNPATDGYTLTADGNIMHVKVTLRYYISDPVAHVFDFTAASNLVQNALNNALHHASAQFTVDKATRQDIAGFKERLMNRVQQLVSAQNLGVEFDPRGCDVTAIPPRQVKAAFDAVLEAENDKRKTINTAQGEANTTLTRAQAEADAVRNAGRSDATRIVQSAQADADYFLARLPEFKSNPQLFRDRRLTETMATVLANAQEKYFLVERSDGTPRELRILLNREPLKPAAPKQQ